MFTNDIVVRRFGQNRFNDREKILLARGFILFVVGVTYLMALYLKDSAHVFDLGVWCFSGFAALFPLVFAAVYWRRATRAGALASLLTTVVVWGLLFYRDIFAVKPPGAGDEELLIAGMMPVIFIFAAAAVSLVVVSWCTRPPGPDTIELFFGRAKARAGRG